MFKVKQCSRTNHASTEFTKEFRVTISLSLGVKISNFIYMQQPKYSSF